MPKVLSIVSVGGFITNILVSFQWSRLSSKLQSTYNARNGTPYKGRGVPFVVKKERNGLTSTYSPRKRTLTKAEEQFLCQFVPRWIKKAWPVLTKGFLQSAKTATIYTQPPVPKLVHLPYLTLLATTKPISVLLKCLNFKLIVYC